VKDLLESHLGAAGRVRAEGRGEANPVADNGTEDGRRKNRRVELTVTFPANAARRNQSLEATP